MGLFRFFPTKDTIITTLATGSNLGSSPTMQCYKIFNSGTSPDLARSLMNFNFTELSGMVFNDKKIPLTGVSYVLKAFDYQVGPVPSSYDLSVCAISGTWDEGIGQDDINFVDVGYANWVASTSLTNWVSGGGDFYTAMSASQHFDGGEEDLEIDVTPIVQAWLTGAINPCGLMLKLSDACENNSGSYYRKVFYSRETHIVENIPFLEARWNDVIKDNRGNMGFDVPNALYMYNFIRGSLLNVANAPLTVRVQNNLKFESASFVQNYSASLQSTGIYAAPVSIPSNNFLYPSSSWYDIWTDSTGRCLMTGTFYPKVLTGSLYDPYFDFVLNVNDLKRVYRTDEQARLTVNVRRNSYNDQLVLHTASFGSPKEYMEDMYYSVLNNQTGETIIPFSTGSVPYTKLSYNQKGNFFNIGMDSFVPGFTYRLIFLIQFNKYERSIIDDKFIFKVI